MDTRCRGSTSCWNSWGEPGSYPRSTSPRATGRCHYQRRPSRRPPSPPPVATGNTGFSPSGCTGLRRPSSGWWTSCWGPIRRTQQPTSMMSSSTRRSGKTTWSGSGGYSSSCGRPGLPPTPRNATSPCRKQNTSGSRWAGAWSARRRWRWQRSSRPRGPRPRNKYGPFWG